MARWLYQSKAQPLLVDALGPDEMVAAWARLPEIPQPLPLPAAEGFFAYPWSAFAIPTPTLDLDWLRPTNIPVPALEPMTPDWFVLPDAAYIPRPPANEFDWYVAQASPFDAASARHGGVGYPVGGASYPWGAIAAATPTLDMDWCQQTAVPVFEPEVPLSGWLSHIDPDAAAATAIDNMQPGRVLRFLIRYK